MMRYFKSYFYFWSFVLSVCVFPNTVVAKDFWLPDEVGADNLNHPRQLTKNLTGSLTMDIQFKFVGLPLSGTASPLPWVGSYWPKFMDSINYRWGGAESKTASEKYALAFGLSVEELSGKISLRYGILGREYAWPSAKRCGSGALKCPDQQICSMFEGTTEGYCTEPWEGICHGWSAASTYLAEPRRGVEYAGQYFEVDDLKALMSLMFTSGRHFNILGRPCKKSFIRGEVEFDEYGRPTDHNDFECADVNAGSMHVIAANFLGRYQKSFAGDVSLGVSVWNHPFFQYEVLQQGPISGEKAVELIRGSAIYMPSLDGDQGVQGYPFNARVDSLRYVRTRFAYLEGGLPEPGFQPKIDASTRWLYLEYILELDKDGGIIGGEWVGDSKRRHPDFLTYTYGHNQSKLFDLVDWKDLEKLWKLSL